MNNPVKAEKNRRFGALYRTFALLGKRSPSRLDVQGVNQSSLDDSQKEMIRGVLDLESMVARDVMIPRIDIFAVKAETGLKEFIRLASEAEHSRIPVYDETIDNIVGIVHVKDLLSFVTAKPKKFDLRKITHKPLFVPETMALDELLVQFRKRRQHLAITVDEYGGVAGLVTMENIIEEIVGDIQDEYDDPELSKCVKKGSREFDVDARLSLSDFSEKAQLSLPEGEFDTVGGYVLDLFGRIPAKGESVENRDGVSFRVTEIRGTRMSRVLVTLLSPEHE
jgi:CBS domain containing-hemolysin-like protein